MDSVIGGRLPSAEVPADCAAMATFFGARGGWSDWSERKAVASSSECSVASNSESAEVAGSAAPSHDLICLSHV